MESSEYLRMLKEKLISDSASWGSLVTLALGVTLLVILMMVYSQG
jgi:ABC-type lipoprotein release transport system permease subunit